MPEPKLKFEPDYPVYPGMLLQEIMEDNNLTVEEVAANISCTRGTVEGILTGKVELLPFLAERLADLSKIDKDTWLRMEQSYRASIHKGT